MLTLHTYLLLRVFTIELAMASFQAAGNILKVSFQLLFYLQTTMSVSPIPVRTLYNTEYNHAEVKDETRL